MGSSLSSILERAETKDSSANNSRTAKYKKKSVYYLDEDIDSQKLTTFPNKKIIEMVVCKCKEKTNFHWFIKIFTGLNEEDSLNVHYVDIGSVIINKTPADSAGFRQTRYTPKEGTSLVSVLTKCLEITQSKDYSTLNFSCQDFVTLVMEEFTARRTNPFFRKLKVPFIQNVSIPQDNERVLTTIKEQFLLESQKGNVQTAIEFLENIIDDIESKIFSITNEDDPESLVELSGFKSSVFEGRRFKETTNPFQKFLNELTDINVKLGIEQLFAKAWRLAILIERIDYRQQQEVSTAEDREFLAPDEALRFFCNLDNKSLTQFNYNYNSGEQTA